MKKAEMSVAEFRATVTGYLDRAKAAIPHEVPEDTLDPCVIELTGELSALETFLHDFGYEERRQASEEERVTQRNTAKQRHATLEEAVMRIDRRVQAAVETLGIPRAEALLLPMQADLIIDGFVQLLDFQLTGKSHTAIL